MFKVKDISLNGDFIIIKFRSDDSFSHLKAELRLKDMTRYAVSAYNQYNEINVSSNEYMHEIKIRTSIFDEKFTIRNLTKQIVWLFVNDGKNHHELKVDNEIQKKFKTLSPIDFSKICNLNFMKKSNNTLAFSINRKGFNCSLRNLYIKENKLYLELPTKEINEKLIRLDVLLKKRIFKDTLIYSESILLNKEKDDEYSLNVSDLNNIHYDKVSNLDFIIELHYNNFSVEIPVIQKAPINLANISFNEHYKTRLYFTTMNSLSLRVEELCTSIEVQKVEMTNKIVTIESDANPIEHLESNSIKCGLFRKSTIINDTELVLFRELNANIIDSTIKLKLDLEEIFLGINSNYEQEYTIGIYTCDRSGNYTAYYNLELPDKKDFVESISDLKVSFTIHKEISIKILQIQNNPIRLSILGSCYSRAAFNSSNNFFNPDYKLYFSLVYSHFWISLISATSERIPFKESLFSDVPDKVLVNVSKEYEKTTFEDLRKINCDYIILDFFVDAVHGCRKLPDGRYLGQNGDMHKSSYYKNHILKETSQFDFRDPDFWVKWKDSCDKFILHLGEIIDLDKVILNWGGLSDTYLNENKELSSFSKDKKFKKSEINFINHTWKKMNNYFISKVPSAKIIELDKYEYHASLDYPYGGSGPHHYERNYYKSFLAELAKVVLLDKIKQ